MLAKEPLEDSVKVAGGGYLASLGVYHELHCLVSSKVSTAWIRLLTNQATIASMASSRRLLSKCNERG